MDLKEWLFSELHARTATIVHEPRKTRALVLYVDLTFCTKLQEALLYCTLQDTHNEPTEVLRLLD